MADHRSDRPAVPGWPPSEVSDRLVELLVAELTALWDRALAAGAAPEQLAGTVDERRRRLRAAVPRCGESGR